MKIIAAALLLTSFSSFAGSIYCNSNSGLVDVLKDEYRSCVDDVLQGAVCFKGSRETAIRVLNSNALREMFEGTDGEYVGAAHFNGVDAISYTYFDQGNDVSDKHVIKRCK